MTNFYKGIAGRRGSNPKGVVIHNDAGSQNANAAFYRNWLPTRDAENGFAHWYVASDSVYQAEDESNKAWHTANIDGNANYIGYEVCQSMGKQETFLANEQAAFKLAAQTLRRYGLSPNRNTVRLHREFSATSCPHRSWDLHGKSVNNVKDYFISQISKYMSGAAGTEPETPVKGNLELLNLNSQAFNVKGWLLHTTANLKNTVPWVFFIDTKTGKEVARFAGEWVSRPDVNRVYKTAMGDSVGINISAPTPYNLTKGNEQFKIMFRASDEKGNIAYAQMYFDNIFNEVPDLDLGCLDGTTIANNVLSIRGWHLSSGQKAADKHFIFAMDAVTSQELKRWDITEDSYKKSADVKRVYNDPCIAQAGSCRFETKVVLPESLEGKTFYLKSRYCGDPKGNDNVTGEINYNSRVLSY